MSVFLSQPESANRTTAPPQPEVSAEGRLWPESARSVIAGSLLTAVARHAVRRRADLDRGAV